MEIELGDTVRWTGGLGEATEATVKAVEDDYVIVELPDGETDSWPWYQFEVVES